MSRRLSRAFYRRDPVTVARALLGQRLVRFLKGQRLAGIIVETEAYLGVADAAAHTFRGRRTRRNESMWCDGGTCYVYFTYGMHHCMNVVCGRRGDPVAVLLRAIVPTEGVRVIKRHRHGRADLCGGPAKLCEALRVDRRLDGIDLVSSDVLFVESCEVLGRVLSTPRIGVDYAGWWARRKLRFVLETSVRGSVE